MRDRGSVFDVLTSLPSKPLRMIIDFVLGLPQMYKITIGVEDVYPARISSAFDDLPENRQMADLSAVFSASRLDPEIEAQYQ